MYGKTMYDRVTKEEMQKECMADVSVMNKFKKGVSIYITHLDGRSR